MKKPAPAVWLHPIPTTKGVAASFQVKIAGFAVGTKLTLEFLEVDRRDGKKRDEKRKQQSGDVQLGRIAGKVAHNAFLSKATGVPSFTFVPDGPPPAPASGADLVEFRFAGTPDPFTFAIPNEALDLDEGDCWEIQVRAKTPKVVSPVVTFAHVRRGLDLTLCRYEWHDGHELKFYHDGAKDPMGDAGAFADLKTAIEGAKSFIFVVDWSFQPMVKLNLGSDLDGTVGGLLLKKAHDGVTVAIHTWDHTTYFAPDHQNDSGQKWLKRLGEELNLGGIPAKLLWRAGSPAGLSHSHHQKFVVLDEETKDGRRCLRAFFGGLDLTQGRLDWPAHPVSKDEKRLAKRREKWGPKKHQDFDEWYNGETDGDPDLPREPWHDIYGNVHGPAAWDFLREFVVRWCAKPGSQMGDGLRPTGDPVCEVWKTVRDGKNWVQQSDPYTGLWTGQLLRSNTSDRCAVASQLDDDEAKPLREIVPKSSERSVLEMYRQAIDHADRFIYIENQYLIGSGAHWQKPRPSVANDLPERIAKKIRAKKGQPFHVYVVTPMFPEGKPADRGTLAVRDYEWKTIRYLITQVADAVGEANWTDYLTPLFLADWHALPKDNWSAGSRKDRLKAHQRYMVYVHSKMMIVDDRFIVFGSANLNERSLAGDRDTEIACAFWPGRGDDKNACIKELRGFREELFVEHFGGSASDYEDPASAACVQSCQSVADANYLSFRQMHADRRGQACRLPLNLVNGELAAGTPAPPPKVRPDVPEKLELLPDPDGDGSKWRWDCGGAWVPGSAAE